MITYKLFILIFSLFIYINLISNGEDSFLYSFNVKLVRIKKSFKNFLNKYTVCSKEKCIFNCLLKNKTKKKWKKYSISDIPGPYPYNYSLNKNIYNICSNTTRIFMSVITPCKELEERMTIRWIYMNKYPYIQFHFFIGYTSKECYHMYKQEMSVFHDISQIPIQESFANETIFTLYLHKYLPIICPLALYYGKMDADVFINFDKLINILKRYKYNKNIIYVSKIWTLKKINTNQEYKYSSPKVIESYYNKELPKEGISAFTGSFTLWPVFLSHELYKESLYESNLIRMDDQHISWLIYKLNKRKYNLSFYSLKCIHVFTNRKFLCNYPVKDVIIYHEIKGKLLYTLSKLLAMY